VHDGRVDRVKETYVRQPADQSTLVKVVLEPKMGRIVNVVPHAFSLLDGQVEDELIDEYQQAATSGTMSALTDANAGGVVTILGIECVPAHLTPDDLRASTLIVTSLAIRRLTNRKAG
jgi:hypothetical protein